MSAYPEYMEDIPDWLNDVPDITADYYESISGGYDDSIYCEPVPIGTKSHATQTAPAYIKKIYPEREKLTAEQILDLADNDLTILAAEYGANWQAIRPQVTRGRRVYKGNAFALDKAHKGKVAVWVEFAEKNGYESVAVTFNTLKHGGAAKKWTSYL